MRSEDMSFRIATESDRPEIEALISRPVDGLMSGDYSPEQLDEARRHIFGVDGELIADRTYWVCEHAGALVAAGGWSRRQSLFGGDRSVAGRSTGELLDPARAPARIRAFFVDPASLAAGSAGTSSRSVNGRPSAPGSARSSSWRRTGPLASEVSAPRQAQRPAGSS